MAFGIRLKAVNKRFVWSSVCTKNDSIRKLLELCQASGVLHEQIDCSFATLGVVRVEQPWARYFEGDKIPTKIGLGQVGIGIGMASRLLEKSGSGSGWLSQVSGQKVRENQVFPQFFPPFLGQKHREKLG